MPGKRTYLLLVPALLVVFMLMIVPAMIALKYSFMTPGAYGGVKMPWSTDSYVKFLFWEGFDGSYEFDPTYLTIFIRSILLAIGTVIITFIIGLPTAWYIATRPEHQRNKLVLLVTIPFWTSLLIRTYCWVLILRDQGLINLTLQKIGLTESAITFLYSDGAILLGLVYTFLPFMILPIYATLERVEPNVIEASYDLYASKLEVFWQIVMPLAKPGILAGAAIVFAPSLGTFLAPDLLGGGKKLMIGSLIQQQFTVSRNWPFGAALAIILMVLVVTLLVFLIRSQKKEVQV